jgi:hypothetical protein
MAGQERALGADHHPAAITEDDHHLSVASDPPLSRLVMKRNSSCKDLRRFQRRRTSSFAELFDGDFAQNLISRNQFNPKESCGLEIKISPSSKEDDASSNKDTTPLKENTISMVGYA